MEKYSPIIANRKEDVGVQVCSKVGKGLRKEDGIGAWIEFQQM